MTQVSVSVSRRRAKAEISRAEILAAAAGMLRRVGYAEMSLRTLAAQVNMMAGSLYYHFASKDLLVTEVMRIGVEAVEMAVREGLSGQAELSPEAKLIVAVRIHLDTMLKNSDFASSHIRCYPFVPGSVRDQLRDVRRSYDRLWLDMCRDFLGSSASYDDVRYLRHALIGALNGTLEWFNPERDSVRAFTAQIDSMLRNHRR